MEAKGDGYADHIASLLEALCDRFVTDGCNDMWLEDSPRNRRLIELAHMWSEGVHYVHECVGFDGHYVDDDGMLVTDNTLVCGYLAHRCRLLEVDA